jgi:hypothetical protein
MVSEIIDDTLKNKIKKFLIENIKDRESKDYERFFEIIKETFEQPQLLSIFSTETNSDIDESILYSILKAKYSQDEYEVQEDPSNLEFNQRQLISKLTEKIIFF